MRVVRNKNITLSWTKLEAPTWLLPPGNLMGGGKASVDDAEWRELESALDAAGFWRMPTNEPLNSQDDPGTAWIVEGRRGRQYHIVNRSSPRDTPYRDAGLVFLRLAGIREEELEANAPGVTFRPFRQPPHIPGLPPPPEPPPPPPPPRSK